MDDMDNIDSVAQFKPGDKLLVTRGSTNKGVIVTFLYYTKKGNAQCKGPGNKLHRINIAPEKLKLIK